MISVRNQYGHIAYGIDHLLLWVVHAKVKAGGPDNMMGIIGIAVLVGLCAGGIALYSGSSILMAFGAYMLVGWLFILTAALVIGAVKVLQTRTRKHNHAYSG